jgi:predicted nucleic acid-binding protein
MVRLLHVRHRDTDEVDSLHVNHGTRTSSVRGQLRTAVAWKRMTRFVVDCGVVLHLATEGTEVWAEHELLAPTLLRSQTLSAMHEAVHAGEIPPNVALDRLTRIWAMPIRLLGDAVLRRRAFDLAEQLGWAETYDAEYLALTQLQADAFVTLDAELARRAEGIVPTATIDALQAP